MRPVSLGEAKRPSRRRRLLAVALVLATVVLVVGLAITASDSPPSSSVPVASITDEQCGGGLTLPHPGPQSVKVVNSSPRATEVLLESSSGGVVAGVAVIGPGTTVNMDANLAGGTYSLNCFSGAGQLSSTLEVAGTRGPAFAPGVEPVTADMLIAPNDSYLSYAATQLGTVAADVTTLEHDLETGNIGAAQSDWLLAMMDWERVGASYDSFGSDGEAVDNLPGGLPGGVNDPRFSGLHRLEYGLWHEQSTATLLPVAQAVATSIAVLSTHLHSPDVAGDATNLPIRAHEILEDALRDHLSGIDDFGAGAQYAETTADLQVTRTVLNDLASLISPRDPRLLPTANAQMERLQNALAATEVNGRWESPDQVSQADHEKVDSAIGALLQTLSAVPDILQVAGTGGD